MGSDPVEAWARLAQPTSFALVGLGGAGGEAVRDILSMGVANVRGIAINTDARHLQRTAVEERILIGERQLQGRGSESDRAAVLDAAAEAREELLRRLAPFEVAFLFAGLGGGTGSALLPYLTSALRQTRTLPIPVAFLPFAVEMETNPERRGNVLDTLGELEEMGGLLLALANEKLRRFESLPMHRVFQVRNAYLHNLVGSLVDMVENPSQLNVDLSSLKSHLRDAGLSTLLCGEYHISEPERLVHQALVEGFLDFRLPPSPSVLLHLDGGANLTLRTVERVLLGFRGRLGEPRRLIFGTRTHSEPREVLRLTAVVGGLRATTLREGLRGRGPPVAVG